MYGAMIVDDHKVYLREISSMPVWGEISGFEVTFQASDGREALVKLQRQPVDLLITDIRMPLVNGLELLKRVVDEKLCTCVILMSQFGDFEYARQGLSSGAFEYLLKPVASHELLSVLQRAGAYIRERRLEISKISYVDNILKRSPDVFFPDTELDNIVSLIGQGSQNALEAALYMVDITHSTNNFDFVKTTQIINRSMKILIESLQNEFPWLGKFLNLQELKISGFPDITDLSLVKEAFIKKIDAILSTIRKYELDIESNSLVRMACKAILENIDTDIKINEIANILFVTRTYLSQVFKEKTGMNLISYLTDVKIDRAKSLISSGINISQISEILGYKDDEYFKRLFKKSTGMTIGEYKRMIS